MYKVHSKYDDATDETGGSPAKPPAASLSEFEQCIPTPSKRSSGLLASVLLIGLNSNYDHPYRFYPIFHMKVQCVSTESSATN